MPGRPATLIMAALAITVGTVTTASAQDSTASNAMRTAGSDSAQHSTGLRSPATAAILGTVIPGAGLAYAGQWRQGVGTYLGSVGGIGLGGMLLFLDRCTFTFLSGRSCNPVRVWPQHALGVAVIGVGLGTWAYGAVNAARIVTRNNARKLAHWRGALGSIEPTVMPPGASGEPWSVGVHATW